MFMPCPMKILEVSIDRYRQDTHIKMKFFHIDIIYILDVRNIFLNNTDPYVWIRLSTFTGSNRYSLISEDKINVIYTIKYIPVKLLKRAIKRIFKFVIPEYKIASKENRESFYMEENTLP